jgi:predicted site-specific integrase-resolvase
MLLPHRTFGNHRRYSLPELDKAMDGSSNNAGDQEPSELSRIESSEHFHTTPIAKIPVALYCRVSQPIQKQNGDLGRQIDLLTRRATEKNLTVKAIYQDVGSGLNDKRPGLIKLFSDAAKGKFQRLLITYPDRLSRFCVSYLERHLKAFGVDVEYVEAKESQTPQEELVQDLLAVIACFSGKLHGMRAKKNFEQEMERVKGLIAELRAWIAVKQISTPTKSDVQMFLGEKGIQLMKRGLTRLFKAVKILN